MSLVSRDNNAADRLIYTWPYPIGVECEVSCNSDDQVVMCPAWSIGNTLGPGRHRWRTPDPMKPTAAYFVLTGPVEVGFDCTTTLMLPRSALPTRVRASGSVTVRCGNPTVLVSQFVGLPFYDVDRGVKQSVARSIERILSRILVRRILMAGGGAAVIDPSARQSIIDELIMNHPVGGAVFGVEFHRLVNLDIFVDDGTSSQFGAAAVPRPVPIKTPAPGSVTIRDPNIAASVAKAKAAAENSGIVTPPMPMAAVPSNIADSASGRVVSGELGGVGSKTANGFSTANAPPPAQAPNPFAAPDPQVPRSRKHDPLASTVRGVAPGVQSSVAEIIEQAKKARAASQGGANSSQGEISLPDNPVNRFDTVPAEPMFDLNSAAPDEITHGGLKPARAASAPEVAEVTATVQSTTTKEMPLFAEQPPARALVTARPDAPTTKHPILVKPGGRVESSGDQTSSSAVVSGELGGRTRTPAMGVASGEIGTKSEPAVARTRTTPGQGAAPADNRGSIMAIGGGSIGTSAVSGEVSTKVPAGGRVLVQGANGLMQAATVKQLLAGYYELEVGSTGEVMWVPMANVIPQ